MTSTMHYTSRDLELLPDNPMVRYEIIDGELLVSKAPRRDHQYSLGELYVPLHDWSRQTQAGTAYLNPGLVFAEDQDVIPDLIWVSRERLPRIVDEHGHFSHAPDIVVEVLSPGPANARRDRELKLNLYSRRGVREYWLVDQPAQAIEVYRRVDAELRLAVTLTDDDVLTSPLLPGFACPLPSLWEPPLDA